ncbi:hypothetical protein Y032_0073g728 [Ancylostoma ceylanicum]|nr:hypothetical protein Y032_0073g728 [Ancylostoma ceylanicum]
MDYLSIHEDDTSIGSDKTDRGYGRWARKRSSIRMFYDESALGDRKTEHFLSTKHQFNCCRLIVKRRLEI